MLGCRRAALSRAPSHRAACRLPAAFLPPPLPVLQFICKDFWTEVFRKAIDNLRTNHRCVAAPAAGSAAGCGLAPACMRARFARRCPAPQQPCSAAARAAAGARLCCGTRSFAGWCG